MRETMAFFGVIGVLTGLLAFIALAFGAATGCVANMTSSSQEEPGTFDD